jgi:hypothetical protein
MLCLQFTENVMLFPIIIIFIIIINELLVELALIAVIFTALLCRPVVVRPESTCCSINPKDSVCDINKALNYRVLLQIYFTVLHTLI